MQGADTRVSSSWPDALLRSFWTGPLTLGLAAVIALRLDRFPQWDEGVFLSQAAGMDGLPAPAASLGPSREIGSVWYQQLLDLFVSNYPNLRALHIIVSIAVLAAAVRELSRAVRVPPAVLTIVLGSYWITLTYLSNFQRFSLLTFVLLGAIGAYLNLLALASPRPIDGVPVALWFSVGLLLGPFEAGAVLVATVLHGLGNGIARRHPQLLATAAATGMVAFGLPFLLDTWRRFGSLSGRIAQLRGMEESPLNTSRFDASVLWDYVLLAVRGPVSNAAVAPSQRVMNLLLPVSVALLVIGVVAALEGTLRFIRRQPVPPEATLIPLAFLFLMLFLGGFYDDISDRYWILPASLLLLLGLSRLCDLARSVLRHRVVDPVHRRRLAAWLGLAVAVGFLVPNLLLVQRIDTHRTGDKQVTAILRLTRVAVGDVPCQGVARYNTPSVQWATGCQMSRATSLDDAMAWALERDPRDGPAFVYWSSSHLTPEVVDPLRRAGFRPLVNPGEQGLSHQVLLRP